MGSIAEYVAHLDFIDYLPLLSFIVSVINIAVTLSSWYYSRTNIVFYPVDNTVSFYKKTTPRDYNYKESSCIAFVYIKVANVSDKPCTISQFTLLVDGYPDSVSSKRVFIRENYILSQETGIKGEMCVRVPLTLPPLGYEEGYLVFPYSPDYSEPKLRCVVIAKTARKEFIIHDYLHRFDPNNI